MAKLLDLIFRFLCFLGFHKFQTVFTNYRKSTLLGSTHFHRYILRQRFQLCSHCGKARWHTDSAPVSSDWSYPERLFAKENA